jgi:hypothetical protein
MLGIVDDERRCPAPKSARRFVIVRQRALDSVERLVRATSTACATLLASALCRTITAVAGDEYTP